MARQKKKKFIKTLPQPNKDDVYELISDRHLTHEDVAKLLSVTPRSVTSWANGTHKMNPIFFKYLQDNTFPCGGCFEHPKGGK